MNDIAEKCKAYLETHPFQAGERKLAAGYFFEKMRMILSISSIVL